MKFFPGLIAVFLLLSFSSIGQENRYIIQLDNTEGKEISIKENSRFSSYKIICPSLGLAVIETPHPLSPNDINHLKQSHNFADIWKDQRVSFRNSPNDDRFSDQWAITLSNIDKVWDFTQGGNTANGDDIVIAIMDNGFDVNHEDMGNNVWINNAEIPDNNIDDDGNGYIDDYKGLNINGNKDMHPALSHGTAVSGLVGAKGNNNQGIAGVNWNVKMLLISDVDFVSEIIESLNYIYDLRKKYNESNGAEGAFVAITSYSAGVDDVFPTTGIHKQWCEMYDLLGSAGILNFGATTNRFVDVDEVGDMPSTCGSDYFVGITSLSKNGQLDMTTGYGKKSIDIAAPGDGILSTKPQNTYGSITGTSAATPIASATAALLYSIPCQKFADLTKNAPSSAALKIKEIIIDGVNKADEMTNLYHSGGYLDAFASLKLLNNYCDGVLNIPTESGKLNITNITKMSNGLLVEFTSPNNDAHFYRWTDPSGRILLNTKFTPDPFGQKSVLVPYPSNTYGPMYLSIGLNKSTKSIGYFFLE